MSHKKDVVRLKIEELKNEGMTFQEISDYLRDNMCIDMSRQAVHSMYKRLLEKQNMFTSTEVVKIVAYTYFGKTTEEICDKLEVRRSKAKIIEEVILKNTELLASTSDIVRMIISTFIDGTMSMTDILSGIHNSFNISVTEEEIVPRIYEVETIKLKERLRVEFDNLYTRVGNSLEAERAFKKMCIDISKMSLKTKV